jgi:hypothetical protein
MAAASGQGSRFTLSGSLAFSTGVEPIFEAVPERPRGADDSVTREGDFRLKPAKVKVEMASCDLTEFFLCVIVHKCVHDWDPWRVL